MVDSTQAMESDFLTPDLVNESKSKTIVVIDPGNYEDVDYKGQKSKKLRMKVNIDGKIKTWQPNKDSVKNMQVFGADTANWCGKPIPVTVLTAGGKEMVIAQPIVQAPIVALKAEDKPKEK